MNDSIKTPNVLNKMIRMLADAPSIPNEGAAPNGTEVPSMSTGADEIIAYIISNKKEISEAFGKTVDETIKAIENLKGRPQETIISILESTVKKALDRLKDQKNAEKLNERQEKADLVATLATKHNGRVFLDPEMLFEALPSSGELGFVVGTEQFAIAASKLRAISKLKKEDLACGVVGKGLHFSWGSAGRLTLKGSTFKVGDVDVVVTLK